MEQVLHTKMSSKTPGTLNINSSRPMSIVATHRRGPSKRSNLIFWPLYLVLIHPSPSTCRTKYWTKKKSHSTSCAKPPSNQAYTHGNLSTDRLTFPPLHLDQWNSRSLFITRPPHANNGTNADGKSTMLDQCPSTIATSPSLINRQTLLSYLTR